MNIEKQGITKDRYTLIPRTLIFVTQGARVLLLTGAPNKRLWANQYNGVGGHIEQGEDVLTAARRELTEETGLSLPELWLCGLVTVDTGREIGIGIFIFRGETTREDLKSSSEGDLEWVRIKDLSLLPLVEDLNMILPLVLSIKKGEDPLFAHYSYDEAGQLIIGFGN
jgi:8-oxo-dGTP diphosphatase